jgi:hypothetical protein
MMNAILEEALLSDIGSFSHARAAQRIFTCLMLAAIGLASACSPLAITAGAGSSALIYANAAPAHQQFKVEEYPLVEQSKDYPNHPQFFAYVPAEVIARRAAWRQVAPEDAIALPNQTLSLFGYRLAMNPNAPFRAYALYQGNTLLQENILHFWPVTLNAASDDFLLPYETLDGTRLVASRAGLASWPGADRLETSPPVFIGDYLAYAAIDNSQMSVLTDAQVLYSLPELAPAAPGQLSAWSGHWALETEDNVIVDGQSMIESMNAERIFHWHTIYNQPFFFYTKSGLTRMHYAGRNLPYIYDQIITGDTPDSVLFQPGGNEHMVWFFALRDGLWYYVEAGIFAE